MTQPRLSLTLMALLLALPVAAQEVAPVIHDGPLGSFTERRPAQTAFASPEARQTEVRRQTMAAMSGLYRSLVAEVEGAGSAARTAPVAARALADLAQNLEALFLVASPAPEGETGAAPNIWTEPERFATFLEAFQAQAEVLAASVEAGEPLRAGLHDLRYYCVACHGTFRRR